MNATLQQIKPETLALIEAQAAHLGMPVDDYLRLLLPTGEQELALKTDPKDDEFEADMVIFAEDTAGLPVYQGTYSREDIYFDHD